MWSELRAERIRREVVAACGLPLATIDLLDALAGLVDEAVPADAACWSTFDPATTMVTSAIGRNLDEGGEAAARFFELEYALDVPGQYRQLAVAGETVVVQDANGSVTGEGHGAMRDHLGSMGLGQELRVLFHLQRAGWGGAGLMRATRSRPFDEDETTFLRHISPVIATAVRASLVRSVPMIEVVDNADGPAVVVFDGDTVVEATPAAIAWLQRLRVADRGHGELPAVIAAVAANAVAGRTVSQRARTLDAAWLVLRGAPLGARRGIVTIEQAGPPEVTSTVSAALGMTARETDVVVEVLRGSSTKEIAASLNMSAYTVQDHLKAVFETAGVNSRRQLIADVFFGVYAPRLGQPIGADGFFTTTTTTTPSTNG